MSLLHDAQQYARFTGGLRTYFSQTLTLDDARRIVRERKAHRNENFLQLVQRAVYDYPASPYRGLLRAAGCEFGDLATAVRRDGIETTLRALMADGVYVTFAQFKGREPLIRNGETLANSAAAFDTPFHTTHFSAETGGSTGQGTRIAHDLDHHTATAPHHLLMRTAHGVIGAPFATWRGVLPDGSGINNVLHGAQFGGFPERWFTHLKPFSPTSSRAASLATYWFVLSGRALGAPVPLPKYVSTDHAEIVAEWVGEALRKKQRALVSTQVSRAVRVTLAAQARGIDFTGATFMIAGEPPTPAKVRAITANGARAFANYGMAEVGRVAMGCARPQGVDDTHLLDDAFALITTAQPVAGFDVTVPAFCFTTLLATTPKFMLNVISDDYGTVQERACGCFLEECGYHTHLGEIHSVNKLTGEGITLVGSDILYVLEEVLPARLGGSPLDYQLVEEEDGQGMTRLTLLISPRINVTDEQQAIEIVLQALRQASPSAKVASDVWRAADTLRVERAEPHWTGRGKFMPLHLQRHLTTEPQRETHA